VHAPVLVACSLLLQPWQAPALLKFLAVSALAITASFSLGAALRALPGLRRVL
jgi:glucan biosynthesis protein C